MIDKLQDLKDIFHSAKTQMERNKEPVEDLIKLNNCISAIVEDPLIITQNVDKEYRKFFFEELTAGALKKLSLEKSRDEKYLDVIANIQENYVRLFLAMIKLGQYNAVFFDSMKNLFNYDTILNLYNYQISEEELRSLRSANQEWRNDLKEGDMIDAIIDETLARCSGWSQARIDQVNGDTLHLEFIFDNKTADRYIDRWSVEVAKFESKTKDLFLWKQTVVAGMNVDAHDKTIWNKATVLEIKDQFVGPNRVAKMALVGFRIYSENGSKSDEKGAYEGWSNRFDEWISIFSPRMQPFLTKTLRGSSDDQDLDDNYDNLVKPEEGQARVFAVPRVRKCTSRLYIRLLNIFGNEGGFDKVLQSFEQEEIEGAAAPADGITTKMDLNIMGIIVQNLSIPYQIYHKEFIEEYGQKFVDICVKRLREAPEKSLRDVRRERIEGIIKSVDNFQRRLICKDEREKMTETLKLEVSLMCLKSSFLERRIQGIRDLNQVIKNNRLFQYKSFTAQYLIEWINSNGVFAILFDPKKTHLQLVQRCNDIVKLLLQEDKLTIEILEEFWSLAKTDYKFEVYKIINEVSIWLNQNHIDYFFEQIKQIPPEKMAIEEFQCLSELGKNSKDPKFKNSVTEFFWDIICNSDNYKDDLVNNCITKFCEMVKYWEMKTKHDFFIGLSKNLSQNKSSIPSIKLFKGLIKDQKDRSQYTFNSSPVKTQENGSASNGTTASPATVSEEITLNSSLQTLIQESNLIKILLSNLTDYCEQANKALISNSETDVSNRKKLFLVNPKYAHNEEIDERLNFLKYIASISAEYQISKSELDTIYKFLVTLSKIPSDQEEFLTWCKSSCEQSSATSQILDLNEVGEFFSEKMNNGSLDVTNLLVVGFDFLQQYFLSVNESSQKLIKSQPKKVAQQQTKFGGYGYANMYNLNAYGGYGPMKSTFAQNANQKEEVKLPTFKILKHPHQLDKLEIVWNIALKCENAEVVPKAIDFLIKVYYSLDEDLDAQRITVQDDLISKCMTILADAKDQHTITRVIQIIKHIIIEAEKKGTGEVKPHSSLLKGELLDHIQIKNRASPNVQFLLMSIYSNTTFWDFKRQVAERVGLSPKYLKLQRANGKAIKDTENGRTLGELGFTTTEQLTAFKVNIEDDVPLAPLIGPNGKLTEKAAKIFDEWYDLYSNEDHQMTKETCTLFIKGCTGEQPTVTDERIVNLFKTYDSNSDGVIERHEFLNFYETASKGKTDIVRENLRHHNIRGDLKKLSEVIEQESFLTQDMPRLKISKKQEYFELLMSLLDKGGEISAASWNLIQMLATSPEIYKRVLQVQSARDPGTGKIDWQLFFDSSNSVYKLLYTLQIVEAVMEEGEGEGLERVDVIDETDNKKKVQPPPAPPLPGAGILPPGVIIPIQTDQASPQTSDATPQTSEDQQNQIEESASEQLAKKAVSIVDSNEDDKLKSDWTNMFLQGNGFQYILNVFMHKDTTATTTSDSHFELKHIAFLLKLLRIFIMAAFSTSVEDSQNYEAASLVRRSSSMQDEKDTNAATAEREVEQTTEGSRFKQLQKLMAGPIGEDIISSINYQQLLQKILSVVSQILTKENMLLEDKLIIDNALSLLVGCILHKNDLINDFYNFSSITIDTCGKFILHGLLFCKQEKIREEFKQSLSCLSQKLMTHHGGVKELPLYYLLRLLSDNFQISSDYQCKQFFELFCELIDQFFIVCSIGADKQTQDVFNPEVLLSLIIDKIKGYNQMAKEKQGENESANSEDHEGIYIGLIQLTGKIIDNFDIRMCEKLVESKKLIDEIFVHFLFASVFQHQNQQKIQDGQVETVVAKVKPKRLYGEIDNGSSSSGAILGKKSKDAAYRLLNNLIKKSPLLMNSFLEKSMLPLMQMIKRQDGWNYTPPGSSVEGKQKYCGLKNLGCICYMNAMMQQFFMIPAFRYNMLSVDDGCPEDLKEYKGNQIDDNILHQLQKLLANLEMSERSFYDPYEFCFAFKDFDGNPTNTGEQKDAQEFLNMKFDRVETLLKPTSRKYLMQSVFGGQTCSQVVCLECGTCKNRIEDFYNLSLTVKDIKSMDDSLKKQIEGEVINEYECETCKKKVDISKRVLLSQSPNVLIVHLQRIIFNFDTFRNDKINSFFEFPNLLDLKPYSFYEVMRKEGRLDKKKKNDDEPEEEEKKPPSGDNAWPEEEDCWEYKLVGVTVHSGTAHAGHYWSYINTKRGHSEPDGADPSWGKTESDPWMEFNDSTVKNFNFEKMKEECYGSDGGATAGIGGDTWGGFGGSYGKSAYMLVYERRIKKPIKILLTKEEGLAKQGNPDIHYDSQKDEYYHLLDYKHGVEEIDPSKIYRQVSEDNQKFEFDNDIYSQEFFDFIKSILLSVQQSIQNSDDTELVASVKDKALQVGKKAILDLLAKCFHNASIKQMVEVLQDIMKQDETMCATFLEQCFREDNCNYLFEILLECTDATTRMYVGGLLKFIIIHLKKVEKDILFKTQTITTGTNAETGEVTTVEQHVALSSRFIMKCLSLLTTQVTKNWARFENFLDIIYAFGANEQETAVSEQNQPEISEKPLETSQIGLEFLLQGRFVERVCDFMLGKKSPLCAPSEKRNEMGGSFNLPNFTPLIKLLTKILTSAELLEKFPLTDLEKKMFLHADLLKVMLSAQSGGKQFGECLANMCRDNLKMSQKVSKVFIKTINAASYDNVKNYLSALKPFLRLKDSLKQQRLEWIFGFSQVIARKGYQQERYKYSMDFVERIADEAHIYICPISCTIAEESLLANLLKCKGKLDTFAINCLKEMLSLMAKDEDIARYVYTQAPHTYQVARYTDWIRPYLEYQKTDVERAGSYGYFKNKHDAILKSLDYCNRFEEKFATEFQKEDKERYLKACEDPTFVEDVQKDYLSYNNDDVYYYYPPQLIIGKQTQDDVDFLVHDSDPLVKVTLSEVICEYNYSNPTGIFNLSIPHVVIKTNPYSTMSYEQFKQIQYETQKKEKKQQQEQEESSAEKEKEEEVVDAKNENKINEVNNEETTPQENADVKMDEGNTQDPQEEEEVTTTTVTTTTSGITITEPVNDQALEEPDHPEFKVRNWFECKREGSVLLKVQVTNRLKRKVKVSLLIEPLEEGISETELNVRLPKSELKDKFYDADTKCFIHMVKIDPRRPFGKLKVTVNSKEESLIPNPPAIYSIAGPVPIIKQIGIATTTNTTSNGTSGSIVNCTFCQYANDFGQTYCDKCGESLSQLDENVVDNYFQVQHSYTNQMF